MTTSRSSLDELVGLCGALELDMAQVADAGGVVSDEMMRELEGYLEKQDDKISALGAVLNELAENEAALKARAEALLGRAKHFETRRERLMAYVAQIMERNGLKKIEGTEYTFTRLDGRERVEVYNEAMIPDDMYTERVVRTVSKTKIEGVIRSGGECPGARIVRGPSSVRFYS